VIAWRRGALPRSCSFFDSDPGAKKRSRTLSFIPQAPRHSLPYAPLRFASFRSAALRSASRRSLTLPGLQAIAIVMPAVANEWVGYPHVRMATFALYAGLIVGATFWGMSCDVIG
jgi:hypothetical protein